MKRRSVLVFLAAGLSGLAALPCRAGIIVDQDTFVLSNEGSNGLISQLLAAGYGNLNLYQALVQIVNDTNPSAGIIITPAFLKALSEAPPSSTIFTTELQDVNPGSQGVAISTDGTWQLVSVFGSTYFGQLGTGTLGSDISGVGRALFTHYMSTGTYLTSWSVDGPLAGMTTTYNVFAIGWTASTASDTPEPASLWLVAAGCLVLLGHALRSRRRNYA